MINILKPKLSKILKLKLKKQTDDRFLINTITDGLIYASLRGIDSHGIRLLPHYFKSLSDGRKNPNPIFKLKAKSNHILIDADHAPGITAGFYAINKGIDFIKKNNFSAVLISIKNSTHPGAMSSIISNASYKNYWCLGFTNADSLMLTPGGKTPLMGTNPFSCTFPRVESHPFMLDMATTITNWNKIMEFSKYKNNTSQYYGADKYGNITKNLSKITQLLPIGDYKGFGLSTVIDIFCSSFTQEKMSYEIDKMFKKKLDNKRQVSQFYIIGKINTFGSKKVFKQFIQRLTKKIRSQKAKFGQKVYCPGDPEITVYKNRIKKGIPINKELFEIIENL